MKYDDPERTDDPPLLHPSLSSGGMIAAKIIAVCLLIVAVYAGAAAALTIAHWIYR